ncbi:MAG: response regulator [Gammaproteobacteria bacterium]|nr:response regulator [Gammaproteobacteria bacterium]
MGSQFAPSDYTVLVVDSDPQVCAELTSLLERVGYHTRTYHSGEALLQSITAIPEPACVIAEVELPGMTGLELITRLRQNNILAPILILTRLGDVATAVRAMRDRVADYLTKPYVDRDLVNRLQNALLREAQAHAV